MTVEGPLPCYIIRHEGYPTYFHSDRQKDSATTAFEHLTAHREKTSQERYIIDSGVYLASGRYSIHPGKIWSGFCIKMASTSSLGIWFPIGYVTRIVSILRKLHVQLRIDCIETLVWIEVNAHDCRRNKSSAIKERVSIPTSDKPLPMQMTSQTSQLSPDRTISRCFHILLDVTVLLAVTIVLLLLVSTTIVLLACSGIY